MDLREFTRQEWQRRHPPKGLRWYWVVLWFPVLLALIGLAACSFCTVLIKTAASLPWVWCGGCLVGILFFSFCRLTPLYVFGHELTHWLAAKCFLRKTGEFHVGRRSGYVEIPNPNTAIILAPYCVPVYFILGAGLAGCAEFFWEPLPSWGHHAICAALGVIYAYHVTMTAVALSVAQEDLKYCGTAISLEIIILGNIIVLYLALFCVNGNWKDALLIPLTIIRSFFLWLRPFLASF